MKGFWQLLRRFIPPYKKYLVLNVVFNLLAALLTLLLNRVNTSTTHHLHRVFLPETSARA